jgi:hypothetical protein
MKIKKICRSSLQKVSPSLVTPKTKNTRESLQLEICWYNRETSCWKHIKNAFSSILELHSHDENLKSSIENRWFKE